jgi:hypothetical protein
MGTNSINPNMLTGPVYGLATTLPARKLTGTEAAMADALRASPAPPASVDADNDPSKLYATIQKDGKTIAIFYTSGAMVTPNGGLLPANLQGMAMAWPSPISGYGRCWILSAEQSVIGKTRRH